MKDEEVRTVVEFNQLARKSILALNTSAMTQRQLWRVGQGLTEDVASGFSCG